MLSKEERYGKRRSRASKDLGDRTTHKNEVSSSTEVVLRRGNGAPSVGLHHFRLCPKNGFTGVKEQDRILTGECHYRIHSGVSGEHSGYHQNRTGHVRRI